mgnify:CR=1 FL=1
MFRHSPLTETDTIYAAGKRIISGPTTGIHKSSWSHKADLSDLPVIPPRQFQSESLGPQISQTQLDQYLPDPSKGRAKKDNYY